MNNKTVWAVLIIIVLVLIAGYFLLSGQNTQAPGMATTTPSQTNAGASGTVAAPGKIPSVGQTVPPAGSNAGKAFTAHITVTGSTVQNNTDYPLVDYKVTGSPAGQGFFSLIGQNTNTVVWGKNQAIVGTYTLDPNSIDVPGNEPSHKLLPGDYFIRIQDSTGAVVGESAPFMIAVRTPGN
jgi:hypothetical protein